MVDFSGGHWGYFHPVRISAGPGVLNSLSKFIPANCNILLITTSGFTRRGITDKVISLVGTSQLKVFDQVKSNPELDFLDEVVQFYKSKNISVIIALGGGSVLDTGKILGVTLCANIEKPLDKMLRQNMAYIWKASLPVIAIPTTSGSGSEATPFATVWDKATLNKYSVSGEKIYPSQVLLDPELTVTLPIQDTLYTGLDMISHALESLWNKNRTPLSETLAIRSLEVAHAFFPIVLIKPEDMLARTKIQTASCLAGMAISQTKTAIAHSISYPLTIHYDVPHGLACSFLLPALIKDYLRYLPVGIEKKLMNKILKMLNTLNLKFEISNYISKGEIEVHIDNMFDPMRAKNYFKELNHDDIFNLLKSL